MKITIKLVYAMCVVWYAGKQSQPVSSCGSDVLLSSSSASPIKMKSPLVVTDPARFSPQVSTLMPASSSGGTFQMGRYMSDSSDGLRRNSAPEQTEVRNVVEPVDSSILETFDPLGYAQNNVPEVKDVEFDVDAVPKETISDLFVARTNKNSSLASGNPSVQSTGSSGSLVDIGMVANTHATVITTGSSISLDTLTGCVREATSLHAADSSESLDGQIGKRRTPAVSSQPTCESGAKPAATSSVPFFPPRISISHLSDGSIHVKPLPANGKQSSGSTEPVVDSCSADHGSVGRGTAFQVVQGLSARPAARSGLVAGTSTVAAGSTIEVTSGLLTSKVVCSVSDFEQNSLCVIILCML